MMGGEMSERLQMMTAGCSHASKRCLRRGQLSKVHKLEVVPCLWLQSELDSISCKQASKLPCSYSIASVDTASLQSKTTASHVSQLSTTACAITGTPYPACVSWSEALGQRAPPPAWGKRSYDGQATSRRQAGHTKHQI